jgi:hypothetical protein
MFSYFISAVIGGGIVACTQAARNGGKLTEHAALIEMLAADQQKLERLVEYNQDGITANLKDIRQLTDSLDRRITEMDKKAAQKTGLMLQPVAKAVAEVRQVVGLS